MNFVGCLGNTFIDFFYTYTHTHTHTHPSLRTHMHTHTHTHTHTLTGLRKFTHSLTHALAQTIVYSLRIACACVVCAEGSVWRETQASGASVSAM